MPYSDLEYPRNGRGILGYTTEKAFVKGDAHANSLENVWSLLKRCIIGSYQQVSAKHLDAYLDELEFRFNNRAREPAHVPRAMCKPLVANNLPYESLIAD